MLLTCHWRSVPLPSQLKFRCLAGLQAGVLGGLLMLAYLSLDAILHRQRWVNPEILLGSAVYGNYAIWHGNAKVILAGFGLQLVLAGIAGILCALTFALVRGGGFTGLLTALAVSGTWYALWYAVLFPSIAPLITQYAARTPAIASHVLLGVVLSRIPSIHRRLSPPESLQLPFGSQTAGATSPASSA